MAQTFEQSPDDTIGNDSSDDSSFEFRAEMDPALLKIQLIRYQDELDAYRLPLEDLQLPEQQMLVLEWINDILNKPKLRIGKKFLSKLEKVIDELNVDWDSEIHITSLIHMIFPKESESIDYVRESYALLIYILMLRTKYLKLPTAQYKIKKCAFHGTKAYLNILAERNRRKIGENAQKWSFWGNVKRVCKVFMCVLLGHYFADLIYELISRRYFRILTAGHCTGNI